MSISVCEIIEKRGREKNINNSPKFLAKKTNKKNVRELEKVDGKWIKLTFEVDNEVVRIQYSISFTFLLFPVSYRNAEYCTSVLSLGERTLHPPGSQEPHGSHRTTNKRHLEWASQINRTGGSACVACNISYDVRQRGNVQVWISQIENRHLCP